MSTYIDLHSVSIDFPIYGLSSRSFQKQLLNAATGGFISSDKAQNQTVVVKALDEISLSLRHGDRVGLIGHNGAGKSTLLRVLAGIYEPTRGHIEMQGNVSALLNVMMGMKDDLTGYQNIRTRCMLQGLSSADIEKKIDQIAEFTELGDYLAMPIRTYSAGMRLRLGFSVVTSIEPEILILDEVIGTGDKRFMKKARDRMNNLINKANIVVIASHSQDIIDTLCNKVITLEAGKVKSVVEKEVNTPTFAASIEETP